AREVGGDHRARATGVLSEEGEELTVDLQMAPRGDAAVTVRDSFGSLMPGASVRIVNTGFYGKQVLSASTGPDGQALFTNLGEGRVSAYATDPITGLRGSGSATLTLEGEMAQVAIDLQDSASVLGRVLLSDGLTPAEDALVVLTRGSKTLQARADANGDFSFESVPLGSFTVFAQEDFGPGLARVNGTLAANGEIVDVGTLVFDDEAPFVVAFDPATGTRDVPLSTAVTVTFNEPLDRSRYASTWFRLRKISGPSASFTASWADGDSTVILTPNSPLANFKGYELTVQDAYDLSGRRLFERARTVFYTVDVVPPTVIDVLPRDGEKQIPIDTGLRITFSEPVVFESLSGAAFQLTDLTTGVGVSTTFVLEPGERQVLLTPATGLSTDRQYQLTVQGVRDGSGNTMTVPVTTAFWTLDTVPPEITSVTFPAGTSFTSGDDVPVMVEANDLHGVARVEVLWNGWSATDASAPYELSLIAPVVAATETWSMSIEVTDVHGNTSTASRDIQISPLINASPPIVATECVEEGEVVVPSVEAEFRMTASDDLAIEGMSFYVDGQLVRQVSPLNVSPAEEVFLWSPPATAQPGETFSVRLEARDFAGNVTARQLNVAVPLGTILVGARSLLDVYSGQDLILAGGTFLLQDTVSLASLTVVRGANLEVPGTASGQPGLSASGRVRLQCGTRVEPYHLEAGELDLAFASRLEAVDRVDAASLAMATGSSLWVPEIAVGAAQVKGSVQVLRMTGQDATLLDGATLETQAVLSPLEVSLTGLFRIETGAHLTVSGEGFPGGAAPQGVVGAGWDYGGSHGGRGARHSGTSPYGETYDSVEFPALAGGGGWNGSRGGGVLQISAGTLELEGEIRANGNSACSSGAGAGGSISVEAGLLRGGGILQAVGGDERDGEVCFRGGGGGGRVSLRLGALEGFDLEGQVDVSGGTRGSTYGAPGTLFLRLPGATYGSLYVDRGTTSSGADRTGPETRLPALGSGAILSQEADGSDLWVSSAEGFLTRWHGAYMVLLDAGGTELGAFRVAALDGHPGRARLEGAAAVAGAATYRGEHRFDEIRLLHGATVVAADPVQVETTTFDGLVELEGELNLGNAIFKSGSLARPASGGNLRLNVSGTLIIESGAVLDVSGLGYLGGNRDSNNGEAPPGVRGAGSNYGGSHGGRGIKWNGSGLPGEVYDSVYFPSLGGGGGYDSQEGSVAVSPSGGGVLVIDASEIVLDGEIRAKGGSACRHSAGGGGTVVLETLLLRGGGTIQAVGGRHLDGLCTSGSGGGGRVALYVDAYGAFDPALQVMADGGETEPGRGWAAPGTVFSKSSSQAYGELRVSHPGSSGAPLASTVLPSIGQGVVGMVTPDGADAWIEPQDPAKLHSLGAVGMWVRIGGTDYRVLAEAPDRRGLLLEGAVGLVAAGDPYLGVYKF
ncbi:MAG: Ig-like domain-containing protein, partial [Acidobacteria bacterium]|nr:Ig-like domain-containing protein [Acidobacteriota bacterium]